MATDRVLVVHESGGTRALLTELLTREGLRVEAVVNTFDCMARHVDEAADLVFLGLGALEESELALVDTLKREPRPPRVIVSFPSPRRDLAVLALRAGADAYVLEPFYGDEVLGVVRGQLGAPEREPPSTALRNLAREVAHAVNNPLQILTLLVAKDRVTKKELMETVPPNVKRIDQVMRHLRDFAAAPEPAPEPTDARPLVEKAAEATGVALDADEVPAARLDPRTYALAIEGLFRALTARSGEVSARLEADAAHVFVRAAVPRDAFRAEEPGDLLEHLVVVLPDRDVLPGLAGVRALLEAQNGSLTLERSGRRVLFVARVPRAAP